MPGCVSGALRRSWSQWLQEAPTILPGEQKSKISRLDAEKFPWWKRINIACAIYIIRFISMILCRCGSQISFEWGIFLYILPSQLVTILCTVWIEFWGSNWCAVQSKHCKDSWHTDTHITHIVVEWWQHSTELSGALNEFRKVVALNIFNQPTDGPRVRNI